MTAEQFFRPPGHVDIDSDNANLDQLNASLCTMLGSRTHNCRWQAMREPVNDAVHQPHQRHHQQSQGYVTAHDLSKGESEIHAVLS